LVKCRAFDDILVLLVWLAEKAGTHAVLAIGFWKRGAVSITRKEACFGKKGGR